jgi:hypothetical protein
MLQLLFFQIFRDPVQYPESVDAPGIAGVVDDGSVANPESVEIVDQSRPSRNDRKRGTGQRRSSVVRQICNVTKKVDYDEKKKHPNVPNILNVK